MKRRLRYSITSLLQLSSLRLCRWIQSAAIPRPGGVLRSPLTWSHQFGLLLRYSCRNSSRRVRSLDVFIVDETYLCPATVQRVNPGHRHHRYRFVARSIKHIPRKTKTIPSYYPPPFGWWPSFEDPYYLVLSSIAAGFVAGVVDAAFRHPRPVEYVLGCLHPGSKLSQPRLWLM